MTTSSKQPMLQVKDYSDRSNEQEVPESSCDHDYQQKYYRVRYSMIRRPASTCSNHSSYEKLHHSCELIIDDKNNDSTTSYDLHSEREDIIPYNIMSKRESFVCDYLPYDDSCQSLCASSTSLISRQSISRKCDNEIHHLDADIDSDDETDSSYDSSSSRRSLYYTLTKRKSNVISSSPKLLAYYNDSRRSLKSMDNDERNTRLSISQASPDTCTDEATENTSCSEDVSHHSRKGLCNFMKSGLGSTKTISNRKRRNSVTKVVQEYTISCSGKIVVLGVLSLIFFIVHLHILYQMKTETSVPPNLRSQPIPSPMETQSVFNDHLIDQFASTQGISQSIHQGQLFSYSAVRGGHHSIPNDTNTVDIPHLPNHFESSSISIIETTRSALSSFSSFVHKFENVQASITESDQEAMTGR